MPEVRESPKNIVNNIKKLKNEGTNDHYQNEKILKTIQNPGCGVLAVAKVSFGLIQGSACPLNYENGRGDGR